VNSTSESLYLNIFEKENEEQENSTILKSINLENELIDAFMDYSDRVDNILVLILTWSLVDEWGHDDHNKNMNKNKFGKDVKIVRMMAVEWIEAIELLSELERFLKQRFDKDNYSAGSDRVIVNQDFLDLYWHQNCPIVKVVKPSNEINDLEDAKSTEDKRITSLQKFQKTLPVLNRNLNGLYKVSTAVTTEASSPVPKCENPVNDLEVNN
jgi:hypothetical protein